MLKEREAASIWKKIYTIRNGSKVKIVKHPSEVNSPLARDMMRLYKGYYDMQLFQKTLSVYYMDEAVVVYWPYHKPAGNTTNGKLTLPFQCLQVVKTEC